MKISEMASAGKYDDRACVCVRVFERVFAYVLACVFVHVCVCACVCVCVFMSL